jgi:hypothetical protein
MLAVKRDQRRAVGDSTFIDRLVKHMRSYHADAVASLSDREIRKRVGHGIKRARSHGLTWEYNLASFVGRSTNAWTHCSVT